MKNSKTDTDGSINHSDADRRYLISLFFKTTPNGSSEIVADYKNKRKEKEKVGMGSSWPKNDRVIDARSQS